MFRFQQIEKNEFKMPQGLHFYKSIEYWLGNKRNFYLHALTAVMMLMASPVLSRSFAAFWKKNFIFFHTSHEILYFERGRKISHEESKNKNRVTLKVFR